MQFLKSLFCLQGFDNRGRYFAICAAVYLIFIMLASAFTDNFFISFALVIVFTVILSFTSLRRLHDAKLNKNWLFAPNITFVIVAVIVIFSQQHSSYYLLIIPALCAAVLLTYPSKSNHKNQSKQTYTLGYLGPVDLSDFQQTTHQGKAAKYRIEPNFLGGDGVNEEQTAIQSSQVAPAATYNTSENQPDIGEAIRLKLLNNKKAQLAIAVILALTLLSVTISWLVSYSNTDEIHSGKSLTENSNNFATPLVREHPLVMPDNFTLFLSSHQGVIINWQADEVSSTELWSQLTAQGDKSCREISFNKDPSFRTIRVHVEKDTEYFASFSPLDSKALIQALAFKGSFSLCGYDFSLKGSQAALGKNKQYANWVEY